MASSMPRRFPPSFPVTPPQACAALWYKRRRGDTELCGTLASCPLSRLAATAPPKGEARLGSPFGGAGTAAAVTGRATCQRPAQSRVPPPPLIPKGGTRLGRGDRGARCGNLCRPWRHGGPPARVLHLKMSHRDIFSLSCACWRYKTVGRCPTPCQLSFEKAGQRTLPAYGAHVRYPLDEHERSELP